MAKSKYVQMTRIWISKVHVGLRKTWTKPAMQLRNCCSHGDRLCATAGCGGCHRSRGKGTRGQATWHKKIPEIQ